MGRGEVLSINYIQIPFWRMGVGATNLLLRLYWNCYKGMCAPNSKFAKPMNKRGVVICCQCLKKQTRASKMPRVESLAMQTRWPESDPWEPSKNGRRKRTPWNCLLISIDTTCSLPIHIMPIHTHAHTPTHTFSNLLNQNLTHYFLRGRITGEHSNCNF